MRYAIRLSAQDDFPAWRDAARRLLQAGIAPALVSWQPPSEPRALFDEELPLPEALPDPPTIQAPASFVEQARIAVRHADTARFALLYALLWRCQTEKKLMQLASDPAVHRLGSMVKAVRREAHKMHAFLRFREVALPEGPRFIAWFEPAHHILRAEADFFVRRFASMHWSILTPAASAHWDGSVLRFGAGGCKGDRPPPDAAEALWLAYFASIFNPARLKPEAMRAEMPERYWANMPEAALIPGLMRGAEARVRAMVDAGPANPARPRQRGG